MWLEIMNSLFAGSNERIPYVLHELYFEEWKTLVNYFFIVLRHAPISRYNYQGLLWCSAYLTMHPMIVSCNRFYNICGKLKNRLFKLLYLVKSRFKFYFISLYFFFFKFFILLHFNEVFLSCHRIDLSILSVA